LFKGEKLVISRQSTFRRLFSCRRITKKKNQDSSKTLTFEPKTDKKDV